MPGLIVIEEPRCKKCSKPIEDEEAEYCYDCNQKQFHYEAGYALWIYDEVAKKSIGHYKYSGRREYIDFYAEEFLKKFKDKLLQLNANVLVPVPLHISKQRQRGFNQAQLFAEKLSMELKVPVCSDIIIRKRKTTPQKELSNKERFLNLEQAFCIGKMDTWQSKEFEKVILVDDIYTTGSTIEACTKVLISAGVKKVYFVSLCIGRGI